MDQKPSMGRIVQFMVEGDVHPAIVLEASEDGLSVDLEVFGIEDGNLMERFPKRVAMSTIQGPREKHWNWPERTQ